VSLPTQQKILSIARHELAVHGFEGLRMRTLSTLSGVAPSVLYYHFSNKEDLLKSLYETTNSELGEARKALKMPDDFEHALKQRILFQFDHAEEITAVLKYYLHFRLQFIQNSRGYLPEKTYLHIEEILQLGEEKGLYNFPDRKRESRVIVHAINGFILEYFPSIMAKKEKGELVDTLSDFILRAISTYQV